MVIVEKYERVLAYLYPIAQSIPNRHKMVRDRFMDCILGIPDLLYDAGKSNQVSKIYQADRAVLHEMIAHKIDCKGTLNILQEIIPAIGCGIPIGSLTSQLFANVYGNAADRFVHFNLKHRNWARYMDDIVILDNDKNRLRDSFEQLNEYSMDKLHLRIGKWQISPVNKGVNFLGYRIWETHKLLRKDSVLRAKRKVANFIRHDDMIGLQKFTASWSGHAQWANAHNLNTWMENRYGISF